MESVSDEKLQAAIDTLGEVQTALEALQDRKEDIPAKYLDYVAMEMDVSYAKSILVAESNERKRKREIEESAEE